MRAKLVMEMNECADDVIEMTEPEAEEVVQAFSLQRSNPRFGECVRVGGQHRRPDFVYSCVEEHSIEGGREFRE